MIAQRFAPGKQVEWNGESFEIVRMLPDDQVQLENVVSGGMTTAGLDRLMDDLFHERLSFAVDTGARKNGGVKREAKGDRYLSLSDCPPALLEKANARLEAIRPLLEIDVLTRKDVDARAKEIAKVGGGQRSASAATLYRWLRDYRSVGCDVSGLIPDFAHQGSKGVWRTDETVERIIADVIDESFRKVSSSPGEKKTVVTIHQEVCRRVELENLRRFAADRLTPPDVKTIRRRVRALDIEDRFASRLGRSAARKRLQQSAKGPEAERPGERVEIDHTKMDLIVIDDEDGLPLGRLTLTDCLDVCTRYPLGIYMGFEPPSYYAVMECLYHAILPKTGLREKYGLAHEWAACGIPSVLVTDNGKEFIGKSLEDACRDLDIVLEQMPVRKPYFKGKVERLFRSVTFLVHGLPGTTFSNSKERGDYDSIGQACLYLSEVNEILTRFIVDVYAESFHKGIGGVPARRWEAHLAGGFSPRVPASAEKLRILLGHTAFRTIQRYGVDFESIRYNCPELGLIRNRLDGREAKIKVHPGDMSRIYVHDPFENRYIEVPAQDPDGYTSSLSLWKHRVIRRRVLDQQDRVDYAALGRARAAIQEIVDKARSRRRIASRSKIKRWQDGGSPPSLEGLNGLPALPAPAETNTAPKPIPASDWPVVDLPDDVSYKYDYRRRS